MDEGGIKGVMWRKYEKGRGKREDSSVLFDVES